AFGDVGARWHYSNFAFRYIIMPGYVVRRPLAHHHQHAAEGVTLALGGHTLAHRRLVDLCRVKGPVVAEIFGQAAVYVEIRHDAEGLVALEEARTEQLEIVDDPGTLQPWQAALPNAVEIAVGEFEAMTAAQ